ncbi:hypothetical protein ACA910_001434 [Epithemia clementina (nom. ined.)]
MEIHPNHQYRAALALNNMATILMQRGCHGSALSTLRDSLTMIRVAFVPVVDATTTKPEFCHRTMLRDACKRLSRSIKSKSQSFSMVEANPIDDDDVASLRSAVTYGPSSVVAFPIRISAASCVELETREITKQFSIILYNHGLASFLVSLESSRLKSRKHMKRSQKSLKMAGTALTTLSDQGGEDISVLLLTALALNVTSAIFQSQNLTCYVEETQRAVSTLCSTVDDGFLTSAILGSCAAAPAA